mmetsp:Transcript_6315/g.14821  ORF Transcript_6315/g.14821 Transcript_6315/m.14821 type:complete len:242 (+) Transcript_6315:214-939(+)
MRHNIPHTSTPSHFQLLRIIRVGVLHPVLVSGIRTARCIEQGPRSSSCGQRRACLHLGLAGHARHPGASKAGKGWHLKTFLRRSAGLRHALERRGAAHRRQSCSVSSCICLSTTKRPQFTRCSLKLSRSLRDFLLKSVPQLRGHQLLVLPQVGLDHLPEGCQARSLRRLRAVHSGLGGFPQTHHCCKQQVPVAIGVVVRSGVCLVRLRRPGLGIRSTSVLVLRLQPVGRHKLPNSRVHRSM